MVDGIYPVSYTHLDVYKRQQLKEQYEEKYTVVCNLPQMEGADYGDLAKQAVEKQKKQQKRCV